MTSLAPSKKIKVLFVCMGNICRSPLGEGVFRHRIEQVGWQDFVEVASAGTHFYHVGGPPDERSVDIAERHGYDIAHQRAQQLNAEMIAEWDIILVMDNRNLRDARSLVKDPVLAAKIRLALDFSREPLTETEVPDPYHGGADGFLHVLRLVEACCDGLLAELAEQHPHLPKPAMV